MKIAILGTRGVPARYGGFETLAEELGRRLVARGHEVTVYGRTRFVDRTLDRHLGMRLVILPAIGTKHLETVSHTLLSALHAARDGHDAALVCNAANAPFVRLLQLASIPVALNVDGLERKRRKWGPAGRIYYRLCERLAATVADRLVTDAEVIRRYYGDRYGTPSEMIVYGGDVTAPEDDGELRRLGLEAGEYLLYVSRFEPENNPDRVAEAYARIGGDRPLVMLGEALYDRRLGRRLAELAAADPRLRMPGAIYGDGYRQLLFGCRLYIHATEVGGTHPALVEAMGAERPVLYHDTPENREVAGGAGIGFRFDGAPALEEVVSAVVDDDDRLTELRAASRRAVAARYRWDDVADAYERLLMGLGGLC